MILIPLSKKDLNKFMLELQFAYISDEKEQIIITIDYVIFNKIINNESELLHYKKIAIDSNVLENVGFTFFSDLTLFQNYGSYRISYDLNTEELSIWDEDKIYLNVKVSYFNELQQFLLSVIKFEVKLINFK